MYQDTRYSVIVTRENWKQPEFNTVTVVKVVTGHLHCETLCSHEKRCF